ncbi:MAG: hypothetical protein JNL58_05810 [Planctomyces sp.]|nr:hypothetical protein [Planctomyces sp.]
MEFARPPIRAKPLKEIFETDLTDEQAAEESDIGSRQLFERIALEEEKQMSWLELQLDLLKRMGEPAYIGKYMSMGESESAVAT